MHYLIVITPTRQIAEVIAAEIYDRFGIVIDDDIDETTAGYLLTVEAAKVDMPNDMLLAEMQFYANGILDGIKLAVINNLTNSDIVLN